MVVELLPAGNLAEMYYIPHGAPHEIEESITDCSDLDDSDDGKYSQAFYYIIYSFN